MTGTWLRTAPRDPEPGLFTTSRNWLDPFALLAAEDPERRVASVLTQAAIDAKWSGAAIVGAHGQLLIEGRAGEGDALMLGQAQPEQLPRNVLADVETVHRQLAALLGPVRIEWVHDGTVAWIVQLHVGATSTSARTIVEGEAEHWREFDVALGLPALRNMLAEMPPKTGVQLLGLVGLTSHVADLLRRWGGPARMADLDPDNPEPRFGA